MDAQKIEHTETKLQQAYRELNVLYEISCAMRTTLELKHVLYIILTGVTAHSGLGYNRAVLFLVNSKSRSLECRMAIGPESGEHANKIWQYIENFNQSLDDLIQMDKLSVAGNQSTLYSALKDLQFPLFLETNTQNSLLTLAFNKAIPWHLDTEELKNYSQDPLLKIFKTTDLIIMPLRAKDKVNGLIIADNCYTQKIISHDDIKIFTMLANQAGLAIENSHLYELVLQKSYTDPVTNLWNHGYFQDKLNESLIEAKKSNKPLSMAIIDIDNFKQVNDTHGHQFGDNILMEIAKIFKDSSREKDYVCRYGGEEFSIVLVDTRREQALDIAERLRKKIEQYDFNLSSSIKDRKITVSIGLATFPEDASSKEELIAKADKAMYIAKFSGKNQTCCVEPNPSHHLNDTVQLTSPLHSTQMDPV